MVSCYALSIRLMSIGSAALSETDCSLCVMRQWPYPDVLRPFWACGECVVIHGAVASWRAHCARVKPCKKINSNMLRIVFLLLAGMGTGYLCRNWKAVRKSEKAPQFIVPLLLFVFGMSIGANGELIANLGRYGWQAAVIACFGIAGSLLAGYVAGRLLYGKGGRRER